ncbi:MAG TPA: hypothetical protein PKW35_04570 [Nannocystaceae bacterium]|nr:hypothetical protein [Nannocystaceae bacterium]
MIEGVDLTALRRSSARAGLVSLLGVLIVFVGIGLSMYRLVGLQDEIASLEPVRAQLRSDNEALARAQEDLRRDNEALTEAHAELTLARDRLSEEQVKLSTEIEGLRAERDRLRESMVEVSNLLEPSGAGGAGNVAKVPPSALKSVRRQLEVAVPATARVRPQASMVDAGGGLYDFSVWLDMPAGVADQIERVTYLLNHPSFRDQNRTVTASEGGFRVSYRGWGCLDSVVVTLQHKTGERDKMVFNMCDLLSRAGSTVGPEPVRPELKPELKPTLVPGVTPVIPSEVPGEDPGPGQAGQEPATTPERTLPRLPEPLRPTKEPIRPRIPIPDKRVP